MYEDDSGILSLVIKCFGITSKAWQNFAVRIFSVKTVLEVFTETKSFANKFNMLVLRVQRLMLSKGAKRCISDDSTWFPKYFWQMTIARSEDINKDDIAILNLLKKLLVSANTWYSFTEEIQIAKFCTEVFVMPKHLMTKLNIPESSLYMSPLHAIDLSQQYCIITVIWSIIVLFAPLLKGVVWWHSFSVLKSTIVRYFVRSTAHLLSVVFQKENDMF